MNPNLWQLKNLIDCAASNTIRLNGEYVPCRPGGYSGLLWRLRCAWAVFTGRADAVVWPEGQ